MLYHPIFLSRRTLLLVAAFKLQETPAIQCLIFLIASLMMLAYLVAVRPFEEEIENNYEIYNETYVLAIAYCLVILVHILFDVDEMRIMGFVIIAFIALLFFSNMLVLLV